MLFSFFFTNCSDAEKIFKGEVVVVQKPKTDKLIGKKINLEGLYTGSPVVFDSIISFIHPSYGTYFASNFNLNTGKHLGNFLNKGQGPGEFTTILLLHPESGYDYWISDFNKRHYVLVDLKSGEEKKRMTRMFQISILDLKTDVLKGFRIAGTQGFDFVRTPLPPQDRTRDSYYLVSVDDDYIYAMLNNMHKPENKPEVHVYDWNGNFVRILETDQKGVRFDFDRKNKKLYFKDAEEEENVWVYDVSYFYK